MTENSNVNLVAMRLNINKDEHPLLMTIDSGNSEAVKALIQSIDNVDFISSSCGLTPLEMAVSRGSLDIVKMLVEKGADAQAGFIKPLREAIEKNHIDIAYYLLEIIDDIGLPLEDGATYLMLAAEKGNLDLVIKLIEKGANPKQTDDAGYSAIIYAALDGQDEVFRYLKPVSDQQHVEQAEEYLKSGKIYRERKEDKEFESFIEGIVENNLEKVMNFIHKGIDVNAFDCSGTTALNWAASEGYLDILTELIKAGADINKAEERGGWTPLMLAVINQNSAIVEELINQQADLEKTNAQGYSALMLGAERGHLEAIKLLLEAGVDPNNTDSKNRLPIYHAAENANEECFNVLARVTANKNAVETERKKLNGRLKQYNSILKSCEDIFTDFSSLLNSKIQE